ncbi:MAG: TPM domain-containing protein [Clostridia bacterium]|nr:TPM domain-containing protein [Clostridia bacterium]
MKKIFSVILTFITALTLLSSAVLADRTLPLVVDNAQLLSEDEKFSLENMLTSISEARQIEVAIVTINSTNGKDIMDYADDFYDDYGYGYGVNDDGAMLVVDMGNREYHITTHGLGATYLNDDALYAIEEAFIDDLSDGYYYDAFLTFANECNEQLDSNSSDTDIFSRSGIALVVGFIIALIIVSTMKGKMTTVRAAKNAANYVIAGSLRLTSQSDRYLYSNTIRTPRNTGNSSGGSGSSMHRSSSGRSHGGRGGRF